eukprot:259236_1
MQNVPNIQSKSCDPKRLGGLAMQNMYKHQYIQRNTVCVVNLNMCIKRGDDTSSIIDNEETSISQQHLVAIILYCDTSFYIATFRKNDPLEPVQLVKTRNAKYFHFQSYWLKLSRILVSLVMDGQKKRLKHKFAIGNMSVALFIVA